MSVVCKRAVDGLVVGDLVIDIGLVERGTRKLRELGLLFVGLLGRGPCSCRCPRA